MPKGTTYDQLVMEVTQRGHNFPFGTAVKSSRLADCWDAGNGSQPVNDAYCSFVGENFNWIVDEYRMKWKAGEPSQGQIETEVEPKFPFTSHAIKKKYNFHYLLFLDSRQDVAMGKKQRLAPHVCPWTRLALVNSRQ